MHWIIVEANQVGIPDIETHYSKLIFTGVFFIALMIAFIWWLRR